MLDTITTTAINSGDGTEVKNMYSGVIATDISKEIISNEEALLLPDASPYGQGFKFDTKISRRLINQKVIHTGEDFTVDGNTFVHGCMYEFIETVNPTYEYSFLASHFIGEMSPYPPIVLLSKLDLRTLLDLIYTGKFEEMFPERVTHGYSTKYVIGDAFFVCNDTLGPLIGNSGHYLNMDEITFTVNSGSNNNAFMIKKVKDPDGSFYTIVESEIEMCTRVSTSALPPIDNNPLETASRHVESRLCLQLGPTNGYFNNRTIDLNNLNNIGRDQYDIGNIADFSFFSTAVTSNNQPIDTTLTVTDISHTCVVNPDPGVAMAPSKFKFTVNSSDNMISNINCTCPAGDGVYGGDGGSQYDVNTGEVSGYFNINRYGSTTVEGYLCGNSNGKCVLHSVMYAVPPGQPWPAPHNDIIVDVTNQNVRGISIYVTNDTENLANGRNLCINRIGNSNTFEGTIAVNTSDENIVFMVPTIFTSHMMCDVFVDGMPANFVRSNLTISHNGNFIKLTSTDTYSGEHVITARVSYYDDDPNLGNHPTLTRSAMCAFSEDSYTGDIPEFAYSLTGELFHYNSYVDPVPFEENGYGKYVPYNS